MVSRALKPDQPAIADHSHPCLNEELGIAAVVSDYAAAFPNAEILVVDNGSDDGTAEAARAQGAVIMMERRRGKATAVASALSAIDTDLVLMVDGDGSYPAEGGRLLVEQYLREPVDMITGIRSARKTRHFLRGLGDNDDNALLATADAVLGEPGATSRNGA